MGKGEFHVKKYIYKTVSRKELTKKELDEYIDSKVPKDFRKQIRDNLKEHKMASWTGRSTDGGPVDTVISVEEA